MTPAPSLRFALAFVALCVVWAGWLASLAWPYDVDDAFILFRYGRHLAQGHGLVWNEGGEPIEGYTNLLYVLLAAGLERVGVAPMVVVKCVGVASWVAMVLLTARLTQGVGRLIACGALLLAPGLAFWAVAGLETTLFGALLLGSLVCFERDTVRGDAWAAGLLFVASLVRTEAPAWAAVLLGLRLLQVLREGGARRLLPWLVVVVPCVAVLVWRRWYFGVWLPNPVLFKSMLGAGAGESVLWPFLRGWWPWCVVAVVGAFWSRRWGVTASWLIALPVFAFASATEHGSVTMTFFDRYLLPVVPMLVITAAEPLAALVRARVSVGVGLVALLLGWTAVNPEVNPVRVASLAMSQAQNVRPATTGLADFITRERPEGYRLALGDVGFVGWRFHGHVDDLFGLNDATYTRGCRGALDPWVEEVLHRGPEGIALVLNDEEPPEAAHEVERRLLEAPGFGARYRRARDFTAGTNAWRYVLFERFDAK